MVWEVQGHNIFLIFAVTFLVSVCLVPLVKRIAIHVGAVDIPNKRKVHSKPMPRMGGLAIFFSFLVGYLLFAVKTEQMNAILIGAFIIVLLGILDDIKPLKARYKFLIQLAAASVVVIYGNIYLPFISAFDIKIDFGIFGYPLAIIFILAVINAINLIDGLDGLAAGTSSIYFATISVIAFMLARIGGLETILAILMLGATLGFLIHNFYPAKIFMGDTGSMFLGYMIAVTALLGFKAMTLTSLFIPILIIFLPVLDTIFAIIRRTLKGKNIGSPDKEHIHHQLLKLNKSVRKTVLILYGINILCAALSIFYALGDSQMAMFSYVALLAIILFLIFKTDVLFKRSTK